MAVNGIGSQSYYEKIPGQKTKNKDSDENIDSKWDEALLQFNNFVEDRVKNGAPKYQIGSSELSIDEWNKLVEKVDINLDDIKEELEQRVKKIKDIEKDKKIDEKSEDKKIDENPEKLILELLRDRTNKDIAQSDTEKTESITKLKIE